MTNEQRRFQHVFLVKGKAVCCLQILYLIYSYNSVVYRLDNLLKGVLIVDCRRSSSNFTRLQKRGGSQFVFFFMFITYLRTSDWIKRFVLNGVIVKMSSNQNFIKFAS